MTQHKKTLFHLENAYEYTDWQEVERGVGRFGEEAIVLL